MIIPGKNKVIPNVPDRLRKSVVIAIRIMEGKTGKKVELTGAEKAGENCFDIKYRTKNFTDPEEVNRQKEEIEAWVKDNPEQLKEGLEFLQSLTAPIMKIAQKMGIKPKAAPEDQ